MSYPSVAAARANAALTIPISTSVDTTLTVEQAQSQHIKVTAALLASVNLIIPADATADIGVEWAVENATSGAFTLTVKNTTGTGVVITQGKIGRVAWNGTNFTPAINDPTASGFAASGSNADITALTNLSGGVTIGGGGLNVAGAIGGNSAATSPLIFSSSAPNYASDANKTLTAAEYAAVFVVVTGTISVQRNLVVPLTGFWCVTNSTTGGFGIQVIGASGTGVVIANGKTAFVRGDSVNVRRLTADNP